MLDYSKAISEFSETMHAIYLNQPRPSVALLHFASTAQEPSGFWMPLTTMPN